MFPVVVMRFAILMAVLIALGLSFAVELITGAEHAHVEPVFLIEVAEAGATSPIRPTTNQRLTRKTDPRRPTHDHEVVADTVHFCEL